MHHWIPGQAVWTERRRGDIQRKWKLPENAMLNAIHAKLNNGELVIAVAKKVCQLLSWLTYASTQTSASAPAEA